MAIFLVVEVQLFQRVWFLDSPFFVWSRDQVRSWLIDDAHYRQFLINSPNFIVLIFFSMTASKFSFRKNTQVVNWLLCKPTLFLGRLNHITFPSLRTNEQLLTTRNGSLRWEKGKAWEKHLAFSSLKPCTCAFSKSYL